MREFIATDVSNFLCSSIFMRKFIAGNMLSANGNLLSANGKLLSDFDFTRMEPEWKKSSGSALLAVSSFF